MIEQELPKKIPGTAVVVGTFGCMTGMYLCVSCVDPKTDIMIIHRYIMEILETIPTENFTHIHSTQREQILKNYKEYGDSTL